MRRFYSCKCLPMKKPIDHQFALSEDQQVTRLDLFLAKQLAPYSRGQVQTWIKEGCVTIDGAVCTKPRTLVQPGQSLVIHADHRDQTIAQAQAIELDILFEDASIIVINKPANLVVHPGAGNTEGTLMNALLYHHPDISHLPRAGIVHRLDKDTTGVMMIAKNTEAFHALTNALAKREVSRQYIAIADGQIKQGQVIDQPIGRHQTHRQKMAIQHHGKPAISHVALLARLREYTLVSVSLETGRTHQIRVHLQSIGHPILGDKIYGKHRGYQKLDPITAHDILAFKRQALHAHHLRFKHPISGQQCHFTAPIPQDMQSIIDLLSI